MRRPVLAAALAALLLTPAAADALPAKGTISFGGVAGVAPGMERAQAEARWGAPGSCSSLSGSTVCTWPAGRSLARVVFDAGARVERVILQGPKRGAAGVLAAYRTTQGIGLGTVVDRLVNTYPRDRLGALSGGLVALSRLNRDQSAAMVFTASPARGGRVSRVAVGSNDPLGASRSFRPASVEALAAAGALRARLEYDLKVDVALPSPDCRPPTTGLSHLTAHFRSPRAYRMVAALKRGNRRAADVRNRLDSVSFGQFERVGRIGSGIGVQGLVGMSATGLCQDGGGRDMSDCGTHPRQLYTQPLFSLVRGTSRRYAYVATSLLNSSEGGMDSIFMPDCGDVTMAHATRTLSFVVPVRKLLSGSGTVRVPAVNNGTEVVTDDESGKRTTTFQRAVLVLSRGAASASQSALPPCEPAKNGALVNPRVDDPEQRPGSRALYATHRLQVRAHAEVNAMDDPDGSQYDKLTGSEHIPPGPGVLGRLAFVGETPGPVALPIRWTVTRGLFGEEKRPHCTGSETLPVTLRKPTPTSLSAQPLLVDQTGDWPRVEIPIAGRPSDDLRPVSVRARRGARGRPRTLFTLPLADVSSDTADFRFSRRFAGMTITSGPRDASTSSRGLVVVDVSVPKLRNGRRLRRDFTLEVVREGRVLLRVRAVLACRGVGTRDPFQACRAPVWRVSRPAR